MSVLPAPVIRSAIPRVDVCSRSLLPVSALAPILCSGAAIFLGSPDEILVPTLVEDQDLFALIGEDGFRRLVSAFYRQVPQDDLLGPMYHGRDLAEAESRLRDFLIFRFGGPPRYIEERGHPRLRIRHAPFAIGRAARDRWMQLMNNAFSEAALPIEAEAMLREFLDGVATFMINSVA